VKTSVRSCAGDISKKFGKGETECGGLDRVVFNNGFLGSFGINTDEENWLENLLLKCSNLIFDTLSKVHPDVPFSVLKSQCCHSLELSFIMSCTLYGILFHLVLYCVWYTISSCTVLCMVYVLFLSFSIPVTTWPSFSVDHSG
jgi:hypothetical protein